MLFIFYSCRTKCSSRFTEEEKANVLAKFLDFPDKNTQDLHLQRLIVKKDVKQRRPRNPEGKQRAASFIYNVQVGSNRVKVCRKTFLNLHSVTQKRVFRLTKLLLNGDTPNDKRGQNPAPNATSHEIQQLMHNHIMSYPVKETHYGNKEVKYLSADLNIKTMHEMFLAKHPESSTTYGIYRQYFRENFNYKFGRPQIDVCCKCEELTAKIKSPHICDSAKRAAQLELEIHKRRSNKFYKALKEMTDRCRKEPNVGCIAFDFMQNLPLPQIPVQEVFYKRQLWVNTFAIADLKSRHTILYVYHEGNGKKGANEVSSFLHDYCKNHMPKEITELHLFSDGAPGQNKNHTMIRTCLGLTQATALKTIVHRFPERGHSFLPCDREFGVYKRAIKRHDRIYTPKQYVEIMANSKQNVTIQMVNTDQILNFDSWWPELYKKSCISEETSTSKVSQKNKQYFTPSLYQEFLYSSDETGIVKASLHIGGLVQHTFVLGKPRLKTNFALNPAKAYPEDKVPINDKKIDDVRQLFKYVEHSEECQQFYLDILSWPTSKK